MSQHIDIFTKPLAKGVFEVFTSKLGVHSYASLRDHVKNKINMYKSLVNYMINPPTIKHKSWPMFLFLH